jgi:hydrogenase maturation protein HypF
MPGGDMAIQEPWRMACAYLYNTYGRDFLKLKIDFVKKLDKDRWGILEKMIEKEINSPLASSAGRLFDAVSALCMIRQTVKYEAQAAIELEKIASKQVEGKYPYEINRDIISFKKTIEAIVQDLQNRTSRSKISAKFHNTLAYVVLDICKKLRTRHKIKTVALSGGVFQNKYLNNKVRDLLNDYKFKVLIHKHFSPNDSSISLGQAAIALRRK